MKKPPIVLTFDEFEMLKSLADAEGVSIGTFVRRLIAHEALKHGLLLTDDGNIGTPRQPEVAEVAPCPE